MSTSEKLPPISHYNKTAQMDVIDGCDSYVMHLKPVLPSAPITRHVL